MYHPMTKEKERLTEMAEKIRAMKREIKYQGHLQNILGDRELRGYVSDNLVKSPAQMAKLQQSRDRLKRAYRQRHVAYCLVRQGITSIDEFSARQNCIEAPYSATKLNMNLVNMHRMRLLTEIAQVYSDYTDELVRKSQQPRPIMYFNESAPISKDVWANLAKLTPPLADTVKLPSMIYSKKLTDYAEREITRLLRDDNRYGYGRYIAMFYPDCSTEAIGLQETDFKRNANGDLEYTVPESGKIIQNEIEWEVNKDDTVNLDFNKELPNPGEPWFYFDK